VTSRNQAWNRSVLLLLLAVAAYFQTWSDLWPHWEKKDATYTHGTLIALISVWLVWNARRTLTGVSAAATPAMLPVVLVLSAAWFLAAHANAFIVHAMLWPLLAFAMVWAGVGWRAASRLAFPLGFLYFAIPAWDYLKPVLQVISAFMVGKLTLLVGVPAHVDGPYVMLPDATIFIALDCSGAHFLSVALAIGALAIWFRGDGLRTSVLILAIAGLLSMVFNWLRILLIVLAYLNPDLRHSLETMGHLTFGWWVFALDLVAFAVVLRFVPTSPKKAPEGEPLAPTPGPAVTAGGPMGYVLAAVAALLLPVSSWASHLARDYPADLASPIAVPGLAGPITPDKRWQPAFDGAAWSHRAAYVVPDGRVVELYRNEYHQQSQGKELISRGSPLFDPAVFSTGPSTIVRLNGANAPLDATRVALKDKSGQEWTALYTYFVDDQIVANASRAQFLIALRSFYGHPPAGVLAMMMPCVPGCAVASSDLDGAMIRTFDAYRSTREGNP
jgi:exosortase